jgi:serine protease Do
MPDNNKGKEDKKYSFIEERILPSHKRKMKKIAFSIGNTVVIAVIFGLISGTVFYLSGSNLAKVFGRENDKKPITFSSPSPTESSSTKSEDKEEITVIETTVGISLEDFTKLYSLVSSVATKFNHSVVTVTNVTSEVDAFDNLTDIIESSYGVVIANNGKELLILTNYKKIEQSNKIRITFEDNHTTDAILYEYDKETGIAILAVSIDHIPKETLDKVEVATMGESYYMSTGTPVLALGSPSGYMYSMEVGLVTNKPIDKYITDYKLELFNTDIKNNPNGEGVVTNMDGEIVGIITHDFSDEMNVNINTVMGITKLKPIIEKLVNRKDTVYFGVVAKDIKAEHYEMIGVTNGVYIVDVDTNSPAIRAGLKCGQVITKINGDSVNSITSFYNLISAYSPGNTVEATVYDKDLKENPEIGLKVELATKK